MNKLPLYCTIMYPSFYLNYFICLSCVPPCIWKKITKINMHREVHKANIGKYTNSTGATFNSIGRCINLIDTQKLLREVQQFS
jgi:hypothetical protein